MQQNDLFHENNQRCAHFRKHSISTPGSSEENSELGTVCDLEERSPSTGTYDVSLLMSSTIKCSWLEYQHWIFLSENIYSSLT